MIFTGVGDTMGLRSNSSSPVFRKAGGALTLVIDPENGKDTQVRWSLSRRPGVGDAMDDLKKREKTRRKNIGMYSVTGDRRPARPR